MRRHAAFLLVLAVSALVPANASAKPGLVQSGRADVRPSLVETPRQPRGTVVIVAGSAWTGTGAHGQRLVWGHVGDALVAAGYRTVAIPVGAGPGPGLASIKRAIWAEQRRGAPGPLCVYGESSGGHLALLAAQQVNGLDCVATSGAPTDLSAWRSAAPSGADLSWSWAFDALIVPWFGAKPSHWDAWSPARHLERLQARVLLMIGDDDVIVPGNQVTAVTSRLPSARSLTTPAGDLPWVHGTTTAAGRDQHRQALVDFVGGS